ncbi:hypothetical protein QBC46DRAFT_370163 [Diplogelasinospora grovesii]|uniref:Fungal N-terminal domain-containing protein n=1 Tax=Diplogelasinospora grovesii TaxID=303347 RepID=A0AAN6S9W5_9PEZI|nr:hypothetical protein QBC46DRAFT_370163 [Diplogelasinospora grovesii]
MTDPITILGAAGTAGKLVTTIGKIIFAISDLRDQWKGADMAVRTFETQLIALRAALIQIKEWTDNLSEDPHHQLIMVCFSTNFPLATRT